MAKNHVRDQEAGHLHYITFSCHRRKRLPGLGSTYTYDAEGNVLTANGSTYVYDALNRRVASSNGTANVGYGTAAEFVYDIFGHRTSTWITSINFGNEGRIYADNRQIAYRAFNGQTFFEHQDWLGTERMRTNYQGQVAAKSTSLAFGEGYMQNVLLTNGDQDNLHFAGLDHDTETNTDHAQFRQYSPTQGRWMSPDPYDGSYDTTNPQSLNRYAYVLNNPLSLVDPEGTDYTVPCNTPGCSGVTVVSSPSTTPPPNWVPSPGPGTIIPWWILEYGNPVCGNANGSVWACPTDPRSWPVQTTSTNPAPTPTAPNNGTPVHGPWTYGNHCGAGGMGTPINGTDAACQQHDACYGQAGFSPGSNYQNSNAQLQACNQQLCNSVRASNQSLIQQANSQVQHTSRGSSPMGGFSPAQAAQFQANSDINLFFTWLVAPGNSCHLP